MSTWGRWLRWAALSLLVATLAFGVVTLRVIADGESERVASDQAFDQGDLGNALVHARRAATLYAPGAPHVRLAYERMVAIALGAERQGNAEQALGPGERFGEWPWKRGIFRIVEPRLLALANDNLARLMTKGAPDSAEARSEAQAWLDRDEAPRAAWVFVLGFGFAATLIGLSWICFRGVSSAGEVQLGRIKWAGLLALIGLACWTLAVLQA